MFKEKIPARVPEETEDPVENQEPVHLVMLTDIAYWAMDNGGTTPCEQRGKVFRAKGKAIAERKAGRKKRKGLFGLFSKTTPGPRVWGFVVDLDGNNVFVENGAGILVSGELKSLPWVQWNGS